MNWKGLQIASNLKEVISWHLLTVTGGTYHMFRIPDDTVHIRISGVRVQTRACKHQHNAQNIVYYFAVANCQTLQFLRDKCTAVVTSA
jgi:hypothetical protein